MIIITVTNGGDTMVWRGATCDGVEDTIRKELEEMTVSLNGD